MSTVITQNLMFSLPGKSELQQELRGEVLIPDYQTAVLQCIGKQLSFLSPKAIRVKNVLFQVCL